MRMSQNLYKLRDILLPFWSLRHADKVLFNKIAEREEATEDNRFEYMAGFSVMKTDDILTFYQSTLEVKGTLEGKLQTSLFSIAIGVGILTSALGFLFQGQFLSFPMWLRVLTFVVILAVVGYMLAAGWFAMKTVSERNKIYVLQPSDYAMTNEQFRFIIAQKTELNSLENIVRQNYMYVAYRLIMNAICAMAIFFMVTAGAALTSEAKHGNAVLELNLEPMQSNIRQIQRDLQSRFTEVDKLRTQINDTRQFLQSIEREKITQQAELRNIANEIEALSKLLGALEQKIAVVESNTKKALTPAPTGSP